MIAVYYYLLTDEVHETKKPSAPDFFELKIYNGK